MILGFAILPSGLESSPRDQSTKVWKECGITGLSISKGWHINMDKLHGMAWDQPLWRSSQAEWHLAHCTSFIRTCGMQHMAVGKWVLQDKSALGPWLTWMFTAWERSTNSILYDLHWNCLDPAWTTLCRQRWWLAPSSVLQLKNDPLMPCNG